MAAAAEDDVAEADLTDPNPNLEHLFKHYDALYFRGALAANDFVVKWGSLPRSSSFGSCTFSKPRNTITLSEPVLKYRSSTDMKNALLHEMIHAIIYVKHKSMTCSQHNSIFRAWMDSINSCSITDSERPISGYNITTRHDFKPEAPISFKGFLWKCKSCRDTLPRARNQGPPSDACCIENVDGPAATCGNMLCYWHNHKSKCGGSYEHEGLQSVTPVPKGTQLLLTYPSETSKSKGTIQESSSVKLQEKTEILKPNVEDEYLTSSSLMKAAKRRRSEVVQKTVLAVEPPKKKQALTAMEKHVPFCPVGSSDAKPLGICTTKKTDKQHKPTIAQTACPQRTYSLRSLKKDLVQPEENELHVVRSRNEKVLNKSSSKKAQKHHELEDIKKKDVLSAAPVCNPKQSSFVASQKQPSIKKKNVLSAAPVRNPKQSSFVASQKQPSIKKKKVLSAAPVRNPKQSSFVASQKQPRECTKQSSKKKEYVVMSAFLDYYETDRSSESSGEPLINKRTVRRQRERNSNSAPSDNSRIDISVNSHKCGTSSRKDVSVQQPRPPSPCCKTVVSVTAEPVLSQVTGGHSQTPAPSLDMVPLQSADLDIVPLQSTYLDLDIVPPDFISPDSAIIYISDDD